MLKRDDTGAAWIRVKLSDPELISWYEQQPDRGRSHAVCSAIALGARVSGDELVYLDGSVADLAARVADLETQLQITQLSVIGHQEDLDQLEQFARVTDDRLIEIEQTAAAIADHALL